MKTFTQLMNELAAHNTPDLFEDETEVNEQTVHLVPHGGRGTHYKVVKGIKGQLEAGEVIHDSHVDDLRDIGIKTKILKEDEMSGDEKVIFESEDVTDLPFELVEEMVTEATISPSKLKSEYEPVGSYSGSYGHGEQKMTLHRSTTYHRDHLLVDKDNNIVDGYHGLTHNIHDHLTNFLGHKGSLNEWSDPETLEAGRKLAAADRPRTKEEEIKIARGQMHGDYKGHASAMRKKHNITEDEQINELSRETKDSYGRAAYDQVSSAEKTRRIDDLHPSIVAAANKVIRKRNAGIDRYRRDYERSAEKVRAMRSRKD